MVNLLAQLTSLLIIFIVFTKLIFGDSDAHARRGRSVKLTGTTSLEAQFFNDLRDQRLTKWSLSDAFFIASGIRDEKSLQRARSWIDQLVEEAREELKGVRAVDKRADLLLQWMHKRVLSRYQARSTDALELIRGGRYNCLSSCLLYGMIGERLGLHIRGIAVEHHAFCRVYSRPTPRGTRSMKSRSGGWDVETTTAHGFNPGRSVQLDQAVVSVPRHRYRHRREISLIEMIGLIYTNHIGLSRAYPTTADRLLAYQKAALFFPRDATIEHNVIAAHTQLVAELVARQSWSLARDYIKSLGEFDSKDTYTSSTWIMLIDRHLERESTRGLERALKQLDSYEKEVSYLTRAAWPYWKGRLLGQAAAHLTFRGQADHGKRKATEAIAQLKLGEQRYRRLGSSKKRVINTLRHNALVPIKNMIISLVNARQLDHAKTILKQALSALPRDLDLIRLKRDLDRSRPTRRRR